MGNPSNDPYSDLLKRYQARRDDYLRRLVTDETTFASDPVANGVARRRGYLKGEGPQPSCSLAEQDAAGVAADDDHHLVVWTDNQCLRAGVPEPWDNEDLQAVLARLWTISDPDQFEKSLVIPEPPAEHGATPGYRPLMTLLRQLAVCGQSDVRARIRTMLASAVDAESLAPDYNPGPTFSAALIERVINSLHDASDPDGSDQTQFEAMTNWLATRTVEGAADSIALADAQKTVKGIYALLPGSIAIDLITAAIVNGRPGPYQPPSSAWQPAPDTWEPPPDSTQPPPSNWEPPPDSWEPPPNTYEDPNPAPPKPRSSNLLFGSVWNALLTLAWFGRVGSDTSYDARSAMLAMALWLRSGALTDGPPPDKNRQSLIEELWADSVWVPPHSDKAGYEDFAWPPYTAAGIYWWRTIILPECIGQLFALNETADFHSTDLLRLVRLFPPGDARIPEYVYTAVKLALLWFKYWWDEPPAKKPNGDDMAEMTMWSENHQILFAQSQLLAGEMYRELEFTRSELVGSGTPRKGSDHSKEGLARVERWLDLRLKFGFSEWNAPGYYNEDLPALFNLVDFCDPSDPGVQDADERTALGRLQVKAAMVLDVMVLDMARFTCRGSFGVTAGRAYWEHKCYGWEQSVGNMIELLFGTRGDFMSTEPAAVALATSKYDVPEALLAIGLDRAILDQKQPFTDRTRVSIEAGDAATYNIGFDSEEDVCFWWGLEGYYTDDTLAGTKKVVAAHNNLPLCGPFAPLYAISSDWLKEALVDLLSLAVDVVQTDAAYLVATEIGFPINIIIIAIDAKNIVDGVADFFKDLWDYLKSISKSGPWEGAAEGAAGGALVGGVPGAVVGAVGGFFIGLAGGGGDKSPQIPDTALQALLEKLLVAFNKGTVLSTANIVTYSNGDAMLSSVQNHLPGLVAFQKQPWMATLDCKACVWTQARFMAPDPGSYVTAWGQFFQDLGLLDFHSAVADILKTPALQYLGKGSDLFSHDGPNYWTGSVALPMIVQHENAAIIAYDLPAMQRSISGFSTHAWFPKEMFDDAHKQDANGGTWFFGRKDHLVDGAKAGSGYVALFSATPGDWTNEDGNNWNNKEIKTDAPGLNVLKGSNIWVCVVSSEAQYSDAGAGKEYDTFCQEVTDAYLNISGVGSANGLECSFDIPRASAPAGASPRLELFYDDKKGRFAGSDIALDGFPRWENQYVSELVATPPSGSGLRPQVEGFSSSNSIGFGSTGYSFTHPPTGLTLTHDTSAPSRSAATQAEQQNAAKAKRLAQGSVTPIRLAPDPPAARKRPFTRPALDISSIRRRTP